MQPKVFDWAFQPQTWFGPQSVTSTSIGLAVGLELPQLATYGCAAPVAAGLAGISPQQPVVGIPPQAGAVHAPVATSQVLLAPALAQLPQLPPQPSGPQARPAQFGVHAGAPGQAKEPSGAEAPVPLQSNVPVFESQPQYSPFALQSFVVSSSGYAHPSSTRPLQQPVVEICLH